MLGPKEAEGISFTILQHRHFTPYTHMLGLGSWYPLRTWPCESREQHATPSLTPGMARGSVTLNGRTCPFASSCRSCLTNRTLKPGGREPRLNQRECHRHQGPPMLICLKTCVLLKQMEKLAIWEHSSDTYLHLSHHLGRNKIHRILVVCILREEEAEARGNKLTLNTCLCFDLPIWLIMTTLEIDSETG